MKNVKNLNKIISESIRKTIKEYIGDEEEFGRYDLNDDIYNLPEEDYESLRNKIDNDYYDEDADMEEYARDLEADQYIGREYYDPTDYDLYRGIC